MRPEFEAQNHRLRVKYTKSYKKALAALSLVILALSITGCGLFTKKNKCLECPKWSKYEKAPCVPDCKRC